MLTKKQFDILEVLIDSTGRVSQRMLSDETGMSIGTVNNVLKELNKLGLAEGNHITQKGIDLMQNYKVKRAIICSVKKRRDI